MILTCPACATQYVVKDGAIPEGGRQVRCAACKHSWHQDPDEQTASIEQPSRPTMNDPAVDVQDRSATGGPTESGDEEVSGAAFAAVDPIAPPADAMVEPPMPAPAPVGTEVTSANVAGSSSAGGPQEWTPSPDRDEFSPFAEPVPVERSRSRFLPILVGLLLIGAAAAAFWFLAPEAWRARLGLAQSENTALKVMLTHSDRQQLASGNELLTVAGRIINPTEESQTVPPIQAELRSRGRLVYSWTIAPPARTLAPGSSATFNSAEVNVPAGADDVTVSLGSPSA